jgi:hypothetical protein
MSTIEATHEETKHEDDLMVVSQEALWAIRDVAVYSATLIAQDVGGSIFRYRMGDGRFAAFYYELTRLVCVEFEDPDGRKRQSFCVDPKGA